ncbi:MAG: ElyC/SanA/YdcF family protein, partial [Marinirhabdus sp.]|nr:ElyC/SanA/YdcF family protein [Marinirhabdus sp.]
MSQKNNHILRKALIGTVVLGLVAILTIIAIHHQITSIASHQLFDEVQAIPKKRVGVLLGTAKYTDNGRLNLYYSSRLKAAIDLFQYHKIDFILVSGDNSRCDYDEPTDFMNDLIALGIPEDCIYLDYAGFSTLDSVLRAHQIFGANDFTIISQKFHNERALYLAQQHNIEAIGYNATEVTGSFGLKTNLREYAARCKAVIDVIFKVEPKFL